MATINLPRIIRIGGGTLAELPEAMAQCGLKRPFVVTDGFLVQSGMVA
ncbi:MAG: alcohol dehydrogenase, partial [Novosphingobium sp.]|nr:alcohol dehydrogenase [Novosphingobium sp.]